MLCGGVVIPAAGSVFGSTLELGVALCRGMVVGISPEFAGNHQVGAYAVACDRHVVEATLPQEHLYVGFVRLRVEVVYEEYCKIDFVSHYFCRYFRIAAHRA